MKKAWPIGLAAAALTLIAGRAIVQGIPALYPVDLPANPRWIPEHALTLYVAAPLTIAAAIVWLLAPGALVVALSGRARTAAELIIKAFLAGFGLRLVVHAALKAVGVSVAGGVFLGADAVVVALLLLMLWRRANATTPLADRGSTGEYRRAARFLLVAAAITALFIPEIFWKDVIGDGFETLYSGWTMPDHVVPRFYTATGFYGLGIGLLSQAYPVSWFEALFGSVEMAARLPVALYATVITAGIAALAELGSPRRLKAAEELAIGAAVVAFVATLGFNSSYQSYSADFAAPLGVEGLTVVCIIGVVLSVWQREFWWTLGFAAVGQFNRPSMILVLAALLVALAMVRRVPWSRTRQAFAEWRSMWFLVAAALAACVILTLLYERVFLAAMTSGAVEGLNQSEFSRLRYLQVSEIKRVLYLVIPCGVVPAMALLAYRIQDRFSRDITWLVAIYFALFYLEAYYSLHHFAPVMVLPLVVFWRIETSRPYSRAAVAAATTGAIAAIAIAWPWGQPVARDTQELARSIQYALPPVDPLAVGSPDGAERRSILGYAFPPEWQVEDTSVKWGFDVVALAYYVQRFANEGRTSRADYRVQPAADPAPGGWTPGRVSASLALFIRDPAAHEARVNHPPSTDFASPVYRIRREQLLKFLGTRVPIHEIDLRDVFERITGR